MMQVETLKQVRNAQRWYVLPNGARLLDWRWSDKDGVGLVLCEVSTGIHPYVTWEFFDEDFSTTTGGDYFFLLKYAHESFYKRWEQMTGWVDGMERMAYKTYHQGEANDQK